MSFANLTTILRYERRGDKVTPVIVRREFDGARWWTSRLTEVPWPIASIERDNEAQAAHEDGYRAARQCTTRLALGGIACQATSGDTQPVLQDPSMAPVYTPYLPLDDKAWVTAHIDWAMGVNREA